MFHWYKSVVILAQAWASNLLSYSHQHSLPCLDPRGTSDDSSTKWTKVHSVDPPNPPWAASSPKPSPSGRRWSLTPGSERRQRHSSTRSCRRARTLWSRRLWLKPGLWTRPLCRDPEQRARAPTCMMSSHHHPSGLIECEASTPAAGMRSVRNSTLPPNEDRKQLVDDMQIWRKKKLTQIPQILKLWSGKKTIKTRGNDEVDLLAVDCEEVQRRRHGTDPRMECACEFGSLPLLGKKLVLMAQRLRWLPQILLSLQLVWFQLVLELVWFQTQHWRPPTRRTGPSMVSKPRMAGRWQSASSRKVKSQTQCVCTLYSFSKM